MCGYFRYLVRQRLQELADRLLPLRVSLHIEVIGVGQNHNFRVGTTCDAQPTSVLLWNNSISIAVLLDYEAGFCAANEKICAADD